MLCGVGAAIGGYRLGFVTRVASWIGMALGVAIGSLVLAPILRALQSASPPQLLLVTIGLLLGAAFLGQSLGLLVGGRLHATLPGATVRSADRTAGAAVALVGVVAGIWVVRPLMADVPGWFAAQARSSAVARLVDDRLPPPPDTMDTLRRLLGGQQLPRVFDALVPAPNLGPPPKITNITQAVVDRVVPSTVRVEGTACRRVQDGSGFVVGPDLVVTNAHVVAGEDATVLQRSDGSEVAATVVAFDPERDLALLRADGLGRPALPLGTIGNGGVGAVFGHPGGGPLRAAPFQVGQTVHAAGTDIYDRRRTDRKVLVLASSLHPGDSGAALVNPNGAVVGVAFAIAPDRGDVAYALDVSELKAVLTADLSQPVDTGPCLA